MQGINGVELMPSEYNYLMELAKAVEDDLLAENQRLKAELAYLKKLQALVPGSPLLFLLALLSFRN